MTGNVRSSLVGLFAFPMYANIYLFCSSCSKCGLLHNDVDVRMMLSVRCNRYSC